MELILTNKLLFAIIAMLIVWKILPLLGKTKVTKKKKEHDIDSMIASKQFEISSKGNKASPQSTSNHFKKKQSTNKSLNQILILNNDEKSELEKVISSLSWGESVESKNFFKSLKLGSSISFNDFSRLLRNWNASPPSMLNNKKFTEFVDIFSSYLFIQRLLTLYSNNNSPTTSESALVYSLLMQSNSPEKLIEIMIQKNNLKSFISDPQNLALLYCEITKKDVLISTAKGMNETIRFLLPIKSTKDEGTKDWAMEILQVNSDNPEQVKKSYRVLRKQYHPDRMPYYKIPDKFSDYFNEKFSKIQKAYEILK